MKTMSAYRFINKDPVIDELRTKFADSGRKVTGKALREIAEAGGPTVACMQGWFTGKTRRPQNATVEAAGRAVGLKRVWVKDK